MKVILRITESLLEIVRNDLCRPHDFAAERVGFLSCRAASLKPLGLALLADSYFPVADSDYVDDPSVGAMMGASAIRKALQFAYNNDVGMFHVHIHEHFGVPRPSRTDLVETAKFVPDFWHVKPQMPHGAIILSRDSLSGRCWYRGGRKTIPISKVAIIGKRITSIWSEL